MNAEPGLTARHADLERVQQRLRDKKLLVADDDAVSLLLPDRRRMLFWSTTGAAPRELPLDGQEGTAGLHGAAYRLRPDAGALASLSTPAALALQRARITVPIVFDEQARHIGRSWRATARAGLPGALAGGANAGLVDGRLLVAGVTVNRMVFNAELFEKCAGAYLIACGGDGRRPTHRIPWWVCLIAGRRLKRDQATAARCHAEGRDAPELTAY